MRIAIVNWTGGGMGGGYQNYLLNILPRFSADREVEALLCLAPTSLSWCESLLNTSKISFFPCQPFPVFYHRLDSDSEKALNHFKPDIIFLPIERYLSYNKLIPRIIMVHNISALVRATWRMAFRERLKLLIQKNEAIIAIKKTANIIVPSKFVYDIVSSNCNSSSKRIDIIYHGSPFGSPINFDRPDVIPLDMSGSFIFAGGTIEPHRGIEDILLAIRSFKKNPRIKGLVIAGFIRKGMQKYVSYLQGLARIPDLKIPIIWTGHLSAAEMAWCFQNCLAFAMTSRVESFGMVAIEALSYGAVCIAAKNPPMPEILETAALYYKSSDIRELVRVLNIVSGLSAHERNIKSQAAMRRAAEFSWETTAEKTVNVFKKILKDSQR